MAEITTRDKSNTAYREAGYRRRVYPRLVANGRMTQEKADREIAIMDAIASDYATLADAEAAKGRLL
jgi:hypothetical protein